MKSKLSAILEIALVYAVIRLLAGVLRSTSITGWEMERLGWSFTGMLVFVGIPALFLLLTHRDWAEYGVNLVDWQFNLDLGIKAYLVRIIPVAFLLGTTLWLNLNYRTLPGGALIAVGEVLGLVIMLVILERSRQEKALRSARNNLIVTGLLLLFPILLAAVMGKLSLLVISTVLWQFVFSGFGEEFVWRGYVQTRLNQAFGRPFHLMGIRFGAGLIITSILFGFFHAFNT
jgi:membrane protease YdiL (CAAX protease family)